MPDNRITTNTPSMAILSADESKSNQQSEFIKEAQESLPLSLYCGRGLKYLANRHPFSRESEYFIENSGGRNYQKGSPIGRYKFVSLKDRGVEPGFKGRKRFLLKDREKILIAQQHGTESGPKLKKFREEYNKLNILQLSEHSSEPKWIEIISHFEKNLPKFKRIHYIKLDYREADRIGKWVRIPRSQGKFWFHSEFTMKSIRQANLAAIRECLANDIMCILINEWGYAQKLALVPAIYQDNVSTPKLLLDGTDIGDTYGQEFKTLGTIMQDGYLIQNQASILTTDDTIRNLGSFKIFLLLFGDRDAIGSDGDNKGFLRNEKGNKLFACIDTGHSLEIGKTYSTTNLMEFDNIQSDFSFKEPEKPGDKLNGGYKNFTVFDDTPFLEKMEGVVRLEKFKDKLNAGEDVCIFDAYSRRFDGYGHPQGYRRELDFSKEIKEMQKAYLNRREYILDTVFKERLPFMKSEEGKLVLNILDCLEKVTSERDIYSPNRTILLRYPRIIKRTEWNIKRHPKEQNSYVFTTTLIPQEKASKMQKELLELVNGKAKVFYNPKMKRLSLECSTKKLLELNAAVDLWKQYEHYQQRHSNLLLLEPNNNLNNYEISPLQSQQSNELSASSSSSSSSFFTT